MRQRSPACRHACSETKDNEEAHERAQTDRIRLGGGSAFFNDRLDAALELVEKGDIDVLMIETLAERTLALLHAAKRAGGSGYWDKLADRLKVLLPACASMERNSSPMAAAPRRRRAPR